MRTWALFFTIACLTTASCTKEKTDYEAEINTVVTEHVAFQEAAVMNSDGYTISVEALNGAFYKGYNKIRLKVTNAQTHEVANVSAVTFLPLMTNANGSYTSCPYKYKTEYNAGDKYYWGYAVFTSESSSNANWDVYIGFKIGNQNYSVKKNITVQKQANKNLNMTTFTGNDGEQYCIALASPQKPKVAENELVAGIYKLNKPADPSAIFPSPLQFSYTEVSGYTLQLDPRMPEPSMGNHSSPNNKNLTQHSDGLYYGVVNYTMTGNWTLNFIMLNENGKILKGTAVPKDFTPGVEGVKSELYIDILF